MGGSLVSSAHRRYCLPPEDHPRTISCELRRALLDTGEAILMEARRGEGSWGIAKSALEFINSKEDPMHYAFGSVDPALISFPVGEQTFKRPRCCANALGKAQPHDNAMLIRY